MTAIEEYTQYEYLIYQTINYMKKTRGAISEDMCDELASVGRLVMWREISTRPPESRDPDMKMDAYLIYRLKWSYVRVMKKASSYWPWAGNDGIGMVEYNPEEHHNTPGFDAYLTKVVWVKSLRDSLERALGVVTDKQRRMIELQYFGGLTKTEVGEIIERTHQNVNITSRKGLATMREQCPYLWPYMEDLQDV